MPSDKVTFKNLAYNASLPPFLARLRDQGSDGINSGELQLAARRNVRGRDTSREDEDAPIVVDDSGNVVQAKVTADGTVVPQEPASEEQGTTDGQQGAPGADAALYTKSKPSESQPGVSIGASRKRKVGKVVGGAEDQDGDPRDGKTSTLAKEIKKRKAERTSQPDVPAEEPKKQKKEGKSAKGNVEGKSGKKKTKGVALSFGDE